MKAIVIYSSLTGNTKKIAEAIYEAIPFNKDIIKLGEKDINIEEYDIVAAGYWVDKGTCDDKIKNILEKINNKEVMIFGTLGAADKGEYYDKIKERIEEILPENNKILGHFLCQGKINEKLTDRYKVMLKENPDDIHIKEQLKNHMEAKSHPDENDIKNAKEFTENALRNVIK